MKQTTSTETYPLELHYVKALFLHQQYRQCIKAGRELLDEIDNARCPLHQPYLCFYLGSAHDELARLIHTQSTAKLPAFDEAAQYYAAALDSLPTAQASYDAAVAVDNARDEDPPFGTADDTLSEASISRQSDETDLSSRVSRSLLSLPPMSPQTHIRTDSKHMTREDSSSTFSDLASTDSFNDVMTPTRLKRDISRMSLIEPPAKQFERPMSSLIHPAPHVLLGPIRPRSPANSYTGVPRLPRLLTSASPASARASRIRQIVDSPSEMGYSSGEPSSPVSPIGSDDEMMTSADTDDTVSPVSPATPPPRYYYYPTASAPSPSAPYSATTNRHASAIDGHHPPTINSHHPPARDHRLVTSIDHHLAALRKQLHTHIRLLTMAKSRAVTARNEHSAAVAATRASHVPTSEKERPRLSGRTLSIRPLSAPAPLPKLPHARSYWSFTPEAIQISEKQRKIQEGQVRDWKRDPFRPERYKILAEEALMEL